MVISASLDPDYFRGVLNSILYSAEKTTGIIHGDGKIFLMEPNSDSIAGKGLTTADSFFGLHRKSGDSSSVFTGKTLATGRNQIMALVNIPPPDQFRMDTPLVAASLGDVNAVYDKWRDEAAIMLSFLLLYAALSSDRLHVYLKRKREFDDEQTRSEQECFFHSPSTSSVSPT